MCSSVYVYVRLGAVHKLGHFKIDLYGSSNNDSTWCYIPSGVLNNDEWWTNGLLSLELALKWVSKSLHHDHKQWKIPNKIDFEKKSVLDS